MKRRKLLAVIALAVAIACGSAFCILAVQRRADAKEQELLQRQAQEAAAEEQKKAEELARAEAERKEKELAEKLAAEEAARKAAEEEANKPFVSPIDFVPLQAANDEVFSWLEVPDMDISLPVQMHKGDINYYLNHAWDGSYNVYGALFAEDVNAKDFSDFNTIIYGHNLKDGSQFGSLKKYRDEEWFNDHRDIIVYTPYKTLKYRIFAAVIYNNSLLTYAFDFEQEKECQRFLDSLSETRNLNSHVDPDMTVTPQDHILTLSTCTGDYSTRYLLVAVLTETDE